MVATHTRFKEQQILNGSTAAPNMETMDIQSGPTANENFTIALIPGVLTHTDITSGNMNKISSQADAKNAVTVLETPLQTLMEASATLGSSINRLSHTIDYLSQASVFTEIATGRVVDADFAKEVVINTKQNIKQLYIQSNMGERTNEQTIEQMSRNQTIKKTHKTHLPLCKKL